MSDVTFADEFGMMKNIESSNQGQTHQTRHAGRRVAGRGSYPTDAGYYSALNDSEFPHVYDFDKFGTTKIRRKSELILNF
jgi:hypothetical protein